MTRAVDVVVIGGGAAGLMCAAQLGQSGLRVTLIEHANRVGKKILMSGGGRCNFTNLATTSANFLSANPHFCKSALAQYTPRDFVRLVDAYQIRYHEKEPGQLFCDDSSKQIVQMLLSECHKGQVDMQVECAVKRVEHANGNFLITTAVGIFCAKQLVIATGGLSIPSMGASGFGYDLAKQFGHSILPLRAGLVPLTLSGKYLEQFAPLSGVALPVVARVGKVQFENALLMTHRGLSGPAILQISSYWDLGIPLQINLLPAGAKQSLLHAKAHHGAQRISDWLEAQFPKRFAQTLIAVYGAQISADRKLAECKTESLDVIAKLLDAWPIVPSGTEGYRTAEVTLGGIDTREINQASMESKRQIGLFFIGEVLDVTGHLGGYNFQWAWASAVAAARAIASSGTTN